MYIARINIFLVMDRRSVEMQQKHIQKMRANIEEKKKQKQESEEIKTQQQVDI